MSDSGKITLPEGEFFIFQDNRDFAHLLDGRYILVPGKEHLQIKDQYDRYPASSELLSIARLACLQDVINKLGQSIYPESLFEDRRVKFDPNLLSPSSYFYGWPPPCEIHYDQLRDFAAEPSHDGEGKLRATEGAYVFISKKWKEALEILEPGVHEFFSHEVEFCDYTMGEHFIFRDCQKFEVVDRERSLGPGGVKRFPTGELVIIGPPGQLVLTRSLVAGRHWMRQRGLASPVISKAFALRILPLLPSTFELSEPFQFYPVLLA